MNTVEIQKRKRRIINLCIVALCVVILLGVVLADQIANRRTTVSLTKDMAQTEIENLLASLPTTVAKCSKYVVENTKLDRMAGGQPHQGVIASAALKDYATVEDMLKLAEERGEKPLLILADGIEDPQNLGALLRVAECSGAHGVIIPKRHAVGLTEAVGRASAGAVEHVPVAKVTNLAQTVEELKEKGLWIFAAEAGGEAYYRTDMTCGAAIILGSEGFGVSRLLKDRSDYLISIPMYGSINSLNVSTAGAVILCEAARQRRDRQ
jgi:23S rRNA (guanosine2251-2'-O)-methyltransferase